MYETAMFEGAAMGTLDLEVTDVTGSVSVRAEGVEGTLSAGDVAKSLASGMSLPETDPWALRVDSTSQLLVDDDPIGEQITTGERLTLTTKSHLGAGA